MYVFISENSFCCADTRDPHNACNGYGTIYLPVELDEFYRITP